MARLSEIRTGSRPRLPLGLRRPPRRADAAFPTGTILIHLRDEGEECLRPPLAPASEFEFPLCAKGKDWRAFPRFEPARALACRSGCAGRLGGLTRLSAAHPR